jgi:hypothetical protein
MFSLLEMPLKRTESFKSIGLLISVKIILLLMGRTLGLVDEATLQFANEVFREETRNLLFPQPDPF